MRTSKLWLALAVLTAAGSDAVACSGGGRIDYRYDTLQNGAIQMLAPSGAGHDIVGVYHPSALRAKLEASLRDSGLVFVARFDSLIHGPDVEAPQPLLKLDTFPVESFYTAYYRLQIDTVLRGVFPHARPLWIRVHEGAGTCTIPFRFYLNKPFLNASNAFAARSDLRMYIDPFPGYSAFPMASWFDGRYLQHPGFPSVMRLDITRILTDYPATSITSRRPAFARPATSGRTYLPDGRASAPGQGRKPAMPLLRKEAR